MNLLRLLAATLLWAAAILAPAWAQLSQPLQVQADLVSSRAAVAPGERFTIALRQRINEGWHTYWRNPGDSGEPTQLTWRAPPGWDIGPIQWPAPEAIPFAMLVNFGYEGEVLFPIDAAAPLSARVGETATLIADAYWLVCSDVCIPEETTLTLRLPVAAQGQPDARWGPRIAAAVDALPRSAADVVARVTAGEPAQLTARLPNVETMRDLRFFPFSRDVVQAAAPQRPRVGPEGASFSLSPGVADNLGETTLEGLIVFETREGGDWVRRGIEIAASPGAPLPGTDAGPAPMSAGYPLAELESSAPARVAPAMAPAALLAAVLLAFLGGVILNVMPCVLPVLAVKGLSFAGGVQAGEARRHGLFYFAGVMATFLALAALLIGVRSAGAAVGWGFQLQAPWVTSALALLFFAIGLNLLGAFHIGGGMQNAGAELSQRSGVTGAFFTGALAVIAATPCAAPFMATAIGAALMTSSPPATLAIFAALGLGFAAPLTALHFAPGLQRLIPRPGAWTERVRNVLAFPMFAVAAWLAWVLAEQTGSHGVLALLVLATALGFALTVTRWGRTWAVAGLAALVFAAAFTWRPLLGMEARTALTAEQWSPARVSALRAEGRGVFVNFTAAWCVSCKVNEAIALTPRVARAFADGNIAYLKADWTNRDPVIAAALADYGRAGVPLYLYYPREGGDPVILPQLLSQDLVLETIAGEADD